MDDDQLLEAIRNRLNNEAKAVPPLATQAEVDAFRRAADLTLPAFYVRLLTEVANGGFGPGFGLIGIPPRGYVETDLREDLLLPSLSFRRNLNSPGATKSRPGCSPVG